MQGRQITSVLVCVASWLVGVLPAAAQSDHARVDVGAQMAVVKSDRFDGTDVGFGGRVAWHPLRMLGVESELNLYPGEFPDGLAFSRRRVEGLFGVTAGPRFDRLRVFGRLRGGFLRVAEAPRPFPCILIFPPPLSCSLAAGSTLGVLDAGGGIEASVTPRTFVRVDVGDRLTRFSGPVFDDGDVRDEGFWGHDFRLAVGVGLRFSR